MAKKISALEARNTLGMVIDDITKYNSRYVITKRGKESVIMLSKLDYLKLVIKPSPEIERARAETRLAGVRMNLKEINDLISEVRNETPGHS